MSQSKNTIRTLQFICPTGFYGAERWILALCKHLDPQVVSSQLAVTLETESKDLKLVKEFAKLGYKTHEVPMSGRFDLSVVDKLVALIKAENIDVIHTHGYKSDILGVWAAKKAGIKCVVTPHGFENAADLKLQLFIWLGCKAMKFADKVVPLSQQLVADVKKHRVREDKIQYIQNGVDLSEVEEFAELPDSRDSSTKRIGFIGQLISRKNVYDILDIYDQLQTTHGNLELILLGDGDERESLESHAKKLTQSDSIQFVGFRDDRLELLKSFDLFVMTSTLEGIPRCLMEAMAMGIPVAAYDISGIDQLLVHNQTGMLAELGDKETLKGYWEQLLFDDELAKRISQSAKEYVYDKYSGKRMAAEYTELFKQLLSTD